MRAVARVAAAVAVGALTLPLVAAVQEDIRTEAEGLGGYVSEASGTPMTVRFFEQTIPVPTDPGEPQGEATTAFTRTVLNTGPTARALASSVWPGPALGDGFATVCGCPEEWRIKADARYPEGPFEDQQEANGSGMSAVARGLDVAAWAESTQSPNAENADYGSVSSRSTSTVLDGQVVSRADASTEDVALLGGIITIDSVRTVLEATSDGTTAATSGQTEVNGLTIAGQGYTVDENGLQPVQDEQPGSGLGLPATGLPPDVHEALGIDARVVQHEEAVDGADARRTAGGLIITVDTTVLKSALTGPLPIAEAIGVLPEDLQVQLFPFLGLGPTIQFVFGAAEVRAAATPPFELPLLPPPPPPPPAVDLPPPPPASSQVFGAPPTTALFDQPLAQPAAPAPAVAPPQQPVAAPLTLPEPFGGIPPAAWALWLALVGLAAYLMPYLTERAMGAAAGAFCDRGAPRGVPHLRGEVERGHR